MASAIKVLIVDDFDLVRVMMRKLLAGLGIEDIQEAKNGIEALGKIESSFESGKPFDLMFLDWNMPELTGIEVVRKCRASSKMEDLAIIMVTAESEKSQVIEALTVGANDYVVKPFTTETIKEKIEEAVSKSNSKAS